MKITVNQLRRIIKEEIEKSLEGEDVRADVMKMIVDKTDEIGAMKKSASTLEEYLNFLNSIRDEIAKVHGEEGRKISYELGQDELRDLMSFPSRPGRPSRDYDEPIGTTVHAGGVDYGSGIGGRRRRNYF